MKHVAPKLPALWFICLHLLPFFMTNLLSLQLIIKASALGNNADHLALLQFKESISNDPYQILASWKSSTHICNWAGVKCDHPLQRVSELNLGGYDLHGVISPHIGNLSFLKTLELQNNSFYSEVPQQLGRLFRLQRLMLDNNTLRGEFPVNLTRCSALRVLGLSENYITGNIPVEIGSLWKLQELYLQENNLIGRIPASIGNLSSLVALSVAYNSLEGNLPDEIGRLFRLQWLMLDNNTLRGEFPVNLTRCSALRVLGLGGNNITGNIPVEIGSLWKLQELYLYKNNLIGRIPASIGNLSSLVTLSLKYNSLEGNLPDEIGRLKNLTFINVLENGLSGKLPSSLYNMSSLTTISVTANQFDGSLPATMFLSLPYLQHLFIGENEFSGPIPTSITNASFLQSFVIHGNYFIGQVPSLEKLQDIKLLNLEANNLGRNSTKDLEFVSSLTNCSKLNRLDLDNNNFGGSLPNSIGNLSNQLNDLYLGGNQFSGQIPITLGKLTNLIALMLDANRFTGFIPDTFGNFHKMQALLLIGNKLTGRIPTSIGNLSQLFELDLSQNMLDGNIPPSIGNCQSLQMLDLSQNRLSGVIPPQVIGLSFSTILLNLSGNSLTGNLPVEVGKLESIAELDVSDNHLSGDIPATVGDCIRLEYLYLQQNSFSGIIPSSLASLKGLQYLDLSRNNLSGSIPQGLQYITVLAYLNVSFNNLDGEVPKNGVFQNASSIAVAGNSKLCGGILELQLPPCPINATKQRKHHKFRLIAVVTCLLAFLFLSSTVVAIYFIRKRNRKQSSEPSTIELLSKVSYQSLHQATNGFSADNMIGSGSFGSVYKGSLGPENKVVAIKVLNLGKKGAHRSFTTECNALKNIRHRNLVKIMTCCSSTNYKGQEFKALVFDYMSNGSLEKWLHLGTKSSDQPRTLGLDQRLKILSDVVSALHYLHHECEPPVIHCDLKPSNVLLDSEMVAHVSDFGLARLLSSIEGNSDNKSSTIGMRGTIGYAPPEYGLGFEVTTQGDMYSFGILVLEMITGRRPTDKMFEDCHNLHNYVKASFPNKLVQIVDQAVFIREISTREAAAATVEHICEDLPLMCPNVEKCLLSLLNIGLACSVESPRERMSIVDVTRELNIIYRGMKKT